MAPRPGVGGASLCQHMVGPAPLKGPESPDSPDRSGAATAPRPPAGTGQAWPRRTRRGWVHWRLYGLHGYACEVLAAAATGFWARRDWRLRGQSSAWAGPPYATPALALEALCPRLHGHCCLPCRCPLYALLLYACPPAPPCMHWVPAPGTRTGAKGCWSSARPVSWGAPAREAAPAPGTAAPPVFQLKDDQGGG